MHGLGSWLGRDHGLEGTFEEAFVAGPESGLGVLMELYESIWKIMWSWDKYQGWWAWSLEKMQALMHLSSSLCMLGLIYTALLEGLFLTFRLIFPWQLAPTGEQSSHSSCGVPGRREVRPGSHCTSDF